MNDGIIIIIAGLTSHTQISLGARLTVRDLTSTRKESDSVFWTQDGQLDTIRTVASRRAWTGAHLVSRTGVIGHGAARSVVISTRLTVVAS